MKKQLLKAALCISLLTPFAALSQESKYTGEIVTAVSKNKDSLAIINNEIGNKIFDLWMSTYKYTKKMHYIVSKNDSTKFEYWETKQSNTPRIIFRVDDISIKPKYKSTGFLNKKDDKNSLVKF